MKSKKLLSLLLAVIMCATLFAFPVAAETAASSTLAISDSNITTKAVRFVFNEDLTSFSAKLLDAKKNEIVVTSSISGKAATIKASDAMDLDSAYFINYTAASASGTIEGCKKITFNKIWADDFEGYSDISGLSANYAAYNGSNSSKGLDGFEFLKRDNNTYLKITNKEIYLRALKTVGVTATYEIDVLAEDSTADAPVSPNFMIQTYPWAAYDASLIKVSDWIDYQKLFSLQRSAVHGETYAFIRETTTTKGAPFYAAGFRNGKFIGEKKVASFSGDNKDWNVFQICRWYGSNLLIDNMKIYTATATDIIANLKLTDSNITTKAVRLVFNDALTGFSAKLLDAYSNEVPVTTSIKDSAVTIKASVPMSLESAYYLSYTASTEAATLEEFKKITFNKIWADDFEGYSDISELGNNYKVMYTGTMGKDFSNKASEFEFVTKDDNTYLKLKGDQIYLKPNNCGVNATYEIDVLASNSTVEKPTYANFMIHTNMYADFYDNNLIKVHGFWTPTEVIYQGLFTVQRPAAAYGETYAFIRETTSTKGSPYYVAAFCNGSFLGEKYKETHNFANSDFNTFAIAKWSTPDLLIDNMKIYTASMVDFEVTPIEFKNISATKSEVTLDFSSEVTNGAFALTQGGKTVAATVSKTNSGKTVVITPENALSLDIAYEVQVSAVPDLANGGVISFNKAFMLKTLFADDFSYENVSDMDDVWNVAFKDLATVYTVSDFNETAGKTVYGLENGWLAINGNYKNGTINIKAEDDTEWNNYTLELDVKRDSGARYALDIMYHMYRQNNKPADYSNNFRLGIWGEAMAEACFTTAEVKTSTGYSVFTNTSHHLKLTTKTGKDLQVFKDGTNVLSKTYNNSLGGGEIGFKAIWDGDKYKSYIDNIVAYKYVELDNTKNYMFLKEANVTETGVLGTYTLAKYDTASLESADVIVAAYSASNQLLGIQIIPVTSVVSHEDDFAFDCTTPGNVSYVKAFLWNSDDGMIPAAFSNIISVK